MIPNSLARRSISVKRAHKLHGWGLRLLAGALLLAGAGAVGGAGGVAQAAESINFPQTGQTLSDDHGFLSCWRAHGGLAQFGYPLSPEVAEVSPTDGRVYLTQWFERNRFEFHPENADPQYKVL